MRYTGLALDYALGAEPPLTITRDGWLVERIINDPPTPYAFWWAEHTPEGRQWHAERKVIERLSVTKPKYLAQFMVMMDLLRAAFDAPARRCKRCRELHAEAREAALIAAVDGSRNLTRWSPIECPHVGGGKGTTGKRSRQVGYKDPGRTKGGFGSRIATGNSGLLVNYKEVTPEVAKMSERQQRAASRKQAIADMEATGFIKKEDEG